MDTGTDAMLGNRKEMLLLKGELDLKVAVMNLLHVQSSMILHATESNITDVLQNFMAFQAEISNIDQASSDIKDISYKTRMLSLNAAIEAARAGASGKGFGVVAEEIGSLSNQTTKCTDEVNKINKNMLRNSDSNKETLDKLAGHLQAFKDGNSKMMADIISKSDIKENGFIITALAKRLENHANFMRSLLENRDAGKAVANHHTCAFGKWYDQNREKYRGIPEYEAIYQTHKTFHDVAAEYNRTGSVDVMITFIGQSHDILDKFMPLVDAFKREVHKDENYFRV